MSNKQSISNGDEGRQRLHIALAVKNLKASKRFYQSLLGVEPDKEQKGYIKFVARSPEIILALNERQNAKAVTESPMHFGIEVQSEEVLNTIQQRLNKEGVQTSSEEAVTCCYAVQNKHWVSDPDGNAWEVYRVLADSDIYIEEGYKRPAIEAACCDTTCCQD